jgi:hypothetical protein
VVAGQKKLCSSNGPAHYTCSTLYMKPYIDIVDGVN